MNFEDGTRFSRIFLREFFSGAFHSWIRSSLRQKRFIDLPLIRGIPRFERVNAKGREGGGRSSREKRNERGRGGNASRVVPDSLAAIFSRHFSTSSADSTPRPQPETRLLSSLVLIVVEPPLARPSQRITLTASD